MEISVGNYHPYELIRQLGKQLKLNPTRDCLEEFILFPPEKGNARLSGFEFSDGIGLILITGIFREDLFLFFSSDSSCPLIFKFSIEGGIFHQIDNGLISHQLNVMQGSITANKKTSKESFRIPSNREVTYAMILLDRTKYMNKVDCYIEDLPEKLQEMLNDVEGKNSFFYEGNYSVGVSECVQDIKKDLNVDIVRATFIEGKTLELLSMLIKQYRDDLQPTSRQTILRKYDLDKILLAKEILISNLKEPPTIKELSKIVGINQTKLKKGFKEVFGKTLKAFLIHQRLELAKILLVKNEKSVQEIANTIGYSNVSHFSRLFKRENGVLPKSFAMQMTTKIDLIKKSQE